MRTPRTREPAAPERPSSPAWLLPLGAIACCLAWGSAFPCIKFLYRQLAPLGLSPGLSLYWLLAGARFLLAGLLLAPLCRWRMSELTRSPKAALLGFSLLQVFLQYLFFYLAISLASGSLLALLTVSGNFFWILLAPVFLGGRWPSAGQWLCLAGGLLGVSWALFQPGSGAGQALPGALCMCAATFCGALGLIVLQKVQIHLNTRTATCISLGTGGLLLLLAAFPAWKHLPSLLGSPAILITSLFLAAVSAFGFGLWNELTTRFPVKILAAYRFLIPIAGVSLSSLFIPGEKAGMGVLGGGLIVLGSVYALQKLSRHERSPRSPK